MHHDTGWYAAQISQRLSQIKEPSVVAKCVRKSGKYKTTA